MKMLLITLLFNISLLTTTVAPNSAENDCDTIVLKSGEEISAKVLKIGENEIEYKKCDNQTGPTYTLKPEKVLMVKYANGAKDIININPPAATGKAKDGIKDERPTEPKTKTAFILMLVMFGLGFIDLLLFILALIGIPGLTSLFYSLASAIGGGVSTTALIALIIFLGPPFILSILSLIFAILGFVAFNKNPDKFKGKGFLIATIIALIISSLIGLFISPLLYLIPLFGSLGLGIYFIISALSKK